MSFLWTFILEMSLLTCHCLTSNDSTHRLALLLSTFSEETTLPRPGTNV